MFRFFSHYLVVKWVVFLRKAKIFINQVNIYLIIVVVRDLHLKTLIGLLAAVSFLIILLVVYFANPMQQIVWKGECSDCVALTFDDGPNSPYTEQILDILQEENVKATFFVLGQNVEFQPEIFSQVVGQGHEVGIHTYSHPFMPNTEDRILIQEIYLSKSVLGNSGIDDFDTSEIKYFRPPNGLITPKQIKIVESLGLQVINFNLDSRDYLGLSSEQIITKVLDNVEHGDIILFHDGGGKTRKETVNALPYVIKGIKNKGYKIVTISEMLRSS
jgi:peptidoglycan-N-acetylglucosamine deacetylase